LHALNNIHNITGSEFEPMIVNLIRSSLFYFYRLVCKDLDKTNDKVIHDARKINWSFYISFVKLASNYDMPV